MKKGYIFIDFIGKTIILITYQFTLRPSINEH